MSCLSGESQPALDGSFGWHWEGSRCTFQWTKFAGLVDGIWNIYDKELVDRLAIFVSNLADKGPCHLPFPILFQITTGAHPTVGGSVADLVASRSRIWNNPDNQYTVPLPA